MIDDKTERVLAEILGQFAPYATSGTEVDSRSAPGFSQLTEFARLLAAEPPEEELQAFLSKHPEFLFALVANGTANEIGILAKPPIGTAYRADFAILTCGQSGSSTHLIELERSAARLFLKDSTPAKTLRTAVGQVNDWRQWIDKHGSAFVADMLRLLAASPEFPEHSHNGSRRLCPQEAIPSIWEGFGALDEPGATYTVIAGRWGELSKAHQERLIFLNRTGPIRIMTYDQLARAAYHRPHRDFV